MRWRTILLLAAIWPLKSELLPVRTYTTADGLAAHRVRCIVPDSRGFLWFCTPEGLSRFDGYHFVSYGVKEGLAHANISAVVETRGGEYFAVGVDASVTGRRAALGIIDDPVKGRAEADSAAVRQHTWDWYKADFWTRLIPNAALIYIGTRWHAR